LEKKKIQREFGHQSIKVDTGRKAGRAVSAVGLGGEHSEKAPHPVMSGAEKKKEDTGLGLGEGQHNMLMGS